MNKFEKIPQLLFIFLSVIYIIPSVYSTITQEWLIWPSDAEGKLKVNSADNISKITNANKTETLVLRYSLTDELKEFNDVTFNSVISSIDLTYFSDELLKQESMTNDKNFMPLFGNYETGLHIAITTKEDITKKEKVNQLMEETCQFINQLFSNSGYSLCQKEDLIYFTDLVKIGSVTSKHFYMFIPNFNLNEMEGFSLYHIFELASKQDLNLGCDFDDETIDDWTSKYFNVVISRQSNMLDDKDIAQNDEEESTVMMKFEEILHFKFPESAKCNVNQHLNEVSVIDDMKKTENNGYTIKNINPRGKKNDELVFIPCPLPKIKFEYKLSPGVGLHPILFTTIEVQEWMENQPLLMLLTLDPNVFADEYQIDFKKYEKGVHVSVYGHPDLEVAVTDKQAKFNFVKVVIDQMASFSKKTVEIPLHLRYPESLPEDEKIETDSSSKNEPGEKASKSEGEDNKETDDDKDSRLFKQIFIYPPRFYTTSTKLCHQPSFCSSSLPMVVLTTIEKEGNRAVNIIPVKSMIETATDNVPLKMDVPRGQLAHYKAISILTTLVTLLGIFIIIYGMVKFSKYNNSAKANSEAKDPLLSKKAKNPAHSNKKGKVN